MEDYRIQGKQVVDYIADYLRDIRQRRVFPNVKPGYMQEMVPHDAPQEPEAWADIFGDVERVVMPGVTHWQSPYMHAYFPALNSPPSLLGDMIADGINCLGFTWASSPACTELECIVMDWLAKMLALPTFYLHSNEKSKGGGSLLTTASEGTLISLLAARRRAITKFKEKFNLHHLTDSEINGRLVAYTSEQAHSSVEKAATMSLITMRFLPTDDALSMRGQTVRSFILKDIERGLYPFYVAATLGTTGACAFDNLEEIGRVCEDFDMWLHVDSAYAGTSFICPELRGPMTGMEMTHSFVFNPSKWLMVHFDCTAMWVRDCTTLHRTFNVEPLYLKHENAGTVVDFMHWQIPLSKRFRALKLWFVIRYYGVRGLQEHVRKGVQLARLFESLVKTDSRFEMVAKQRLGVVTFRLKGENFLTETLLRRINTTGAMHMVPASVKGKYIIRYVITSPATNENDVARDWNLIQQWGQFVCEEEGVSPVATTSDMSMAVPTPSYSAVELEKLRSRRAAFLKHRRHFGLSLLLSNVPSIPSFVNGSYAAMFENEEAMQDFVQQVIDWVSTRPMSFSPLVQAIPKMYKRRLSVDALQVEANCGLPQESEQEKADSTGEEVSTNSAAFLEEEEANNRPQKCAPSFAGCQKLMREKARLKDRLNSLDSKIDGIINLVCVEEPREDEGKEGED